MLCRRPEPTLASLDQHRTAGPTNAAPHHPAGQGDDEHRGHEAAEGSPLLLSFRDSQFPSAAEKSPKQCCSALHHPLKFQDI